VVGFPAGFLFIVAALQTAFAAQMWLHTPALKQTARRVVGLAPGHLSLRSKPLLQPGLS